MDKQTHMNEDEILMRVRDLKKHFQVSAGFFGQNPKFLKAVDGVDLDIRRGETLGLVGESGCGKSTLARTLIRLYSPTDGVIEFNGTDLAKLKEKDILAIVRKSNKPQPSQ